MSHEAVSFEEVMGPGAALPSRTSRERRDSLLRLGTIISLVMALACVIWIPILQYRYALQESRAADQTAAATAAWPTGETAKELSKVQRYNQGIAAHGQESLGEITDPFQPGKGDRSLSERDKTYQDLLNMGHGAMGSIHIPKISVAMPIYHGTSDLALQLGAGHLYGTSLPVGGPSTNAVLSGHRGLAGALLFTRLDELVIGDPIYVKTLGHTIGYKVESIHVVTPEDTHLYKVSQGRDLLTLMTCTPYGVNTHRLVITATRQRIPDGVPSLDDAAGDALLRALEIGFAVLTVGVVPLVFRGRSALYPDHASRELVAGGR